MTETGACNCGGVTVTMPAESKYMAYCHCVNCRTTTGGLFIGAAGHSPDDVSIEFAEGVGLQQHRTSSYLVRHRCSRCGSAIYNEVDVRGRVTLNVMTALFGGRVRPKFHIYYADRVVDVADELPKFDEFGMP